MSDVQTLETTRDVVTALGGMKAVAVLTGRKYTAVSNWVNSKDPHPEFPPRTFLKMTQALAEIGKQAPPSLWGME